jgi:hypothetical protein
LEVIPRETLGLVPLGTTEGETGGFYGLAETAFRKKLPDALIALRLNIPSLDFPSRFSSSVAIYRAGLVLLSLQLPI